MSETTIPVGTNDYQQHDKGKAELVNLEARLQTFAGKGDSFDSIEALMDDLSADNISMPKKKETPSAEEFKETLDGAQAWAKSAGYKEKDVAEIIKSARMKRIP